jgi:hypothetical protein
VYASVLVLNLRAIIEGLPPIPKWFISLQDVSWCAHSGSALETYHLHWLLLRSVVTTS